MPYADRYDEDFGRPTRSLLYGPDKTKKTLWSCRAAEAGFNVILIDGDNGSSIVNAIDTNTKKHLLSLEARKRILIIDAVNTPTVNVFARFTATFMRGEPFLWDEKGKVSLPVVHARKPEKSYVLFDVSKFTMNDLVVLDSWTRLAQSLLFEWARENNVDLTSVDKEGDQFSLMGYQSRFLDYVLGKLGTFPCHFIVIGHETVYEKFEGKGKDRKVVEQRTQPFSSTGPHAKKLGAHFSNCLRFTKLSDLAFRIDAGGDASTMGGCRQLAPAKYDWKSISPADIFKAVGSVADGSPCLGAIYIPPGAVQHEQITQIQKSIPPATTVDAAKPQVVDAEKADGKVSLMSKLKRTATS